LGEYRFAIAQSRHRVSYEGWLRQWTAAVEILDIDDGSTHSYSTIALELKRKGAPIPTNDLWIAALCRQHSLPLLSRDKHFDSVPGLQRLHW
jgi:predicted nucleic acid-binding protein